MPAATAACTVATHSAKVVSPHNTPSPPPPKVSAETAGSLPKLCCCITGLSILPNGCHRANAQRNKAKRFRLQVILLWKASADEAQEPIDEHGCLGKKQGGDPRRGRDDILDHPRAQLLAFPQRHDAVAGPGDLPDAERLVRPQLCPDRADHVDHAGGLVGATAGDRAICRSSPAARSEEHT